MQTRRALPRMGQLHTSHQHRWNALGARRRGPLAQQVGRKRYTASLGPPLGDHPCLAGGLQARRNGNAVGGVRTTVRYSTAHLASLYKNHGQFVSAWARAVQRDRTHGFLLPPDADEPSHSAAVSNAALQDH